MSKKFKFSAVTVCIFAMSLYLAYNSNLYGNNLNEFLSGYF